MTTKLTCVNTENSRKPVTTCPPPSACVSLSLSLSLTCPRARSWTRMPADHRQQRCATFSLFLISYFLRRLRQVPRPTAVILSGAELDCARNGEPILFQSPCARARVCVRATGRAIRAGACVRSSPLRASSNPARLPPRLLPRPAP